MCRRYEIRSRTVCARSSLGLPSEQWRLRSSRCLRTYFGTDMVDQRPRIKQCEGKRPSVIASLVTMDCQLVKCPCDSKECKHSLLTIDFLCIRVKYTPPALDFVFGNGNSGAHCLNSTFCYRRCTYRITVHCRKDAGPRHKSSRCCGLLGLCIMLILLISDAERMRVYVLAEDVTEAQEDRRKGMQSPRPNLPR